MRQERCGCTAPTGPRSDAQCGSCDKVQCYAGQRRGREERDEYRQAGYCVVYMDKCQARRLFQNKNVGGCRCSLACGQAGMDPTASITSAGVDLRGCEDAESDCYSSFRQSPPAMSLCNQHNSSNGECRSDRVIEKRQQGHENEIMLELQP